MRAQHVEYHAPARFDDQLEVFVRVAKIGRTSVRWQFEAIDVTTGAHLVTADQTVVQIDPVARRAACRQPGVSRTAVSRVRSPTSRLLSALEAMPSPIRGTAISRFEDDTERVILLRNLLSVGAVVAVFFICGVAALLVAAAVCVVFEFSMRALDSHGRKRTTS